MTPNEFSEQQGFSIGIVGVCIHCDRKDIYRLVWQYAQGNEVVIYAYDKDYNRIVRILSIDCDFGFFRAKTAWQPWDFIFTIEEEA